jgi:CheY-like chemotaxis protein
MTNKIDTTKNQALKTYVLLAEDDLINQEVIIEMLESLSCKVDVVANGKELLRLMSQTQFDIILMNCEMPEMDGFQATIEIRRLENSACNRIPIIALTANVVTGYKEKCLEVGMDDYLSKPFDQKQLSETLSRWV